MSKNIDQVLAVTNSLIRYGIGEIFALLQKKIMNGVKVMMIISFEVNTVSTAMIKVRIKNSVVCFPFAFFRAYIASTLKKPTSSKIVEMNIKEKNRESISRGLIPSLEIN